MSELPRQYLFIHVFMYQFLYLFVYVFICVYMFAYVFLCIYIYIAYYIIIYIYDYICACIYIYLFILFILYVQIRGHTNIAGRLSCKRLWWEFVFQLEDFVASPSGHPWLSLNCRSINSTWSFSAIICSSSSSLRLCNGH